MKLEQRPFFSICIPAYNRANFLSSLLDSILAQKFEDYEIVICEDKSRERDEIRAIAEAYSSRPRVRLRYIENEKNLGYDGNIRKLIHESHGRYVFFMGNDDLMCPDALIKAADVIGRFPNVGFVLKGYGWFAGEETNLRARIRYVQSATLYQSGTETIAFCFRRSGVISGFIVKRDCAERCATSSFDGTLYYQMHVVGRVLLEMNAVAIPDILVLCRGDQPPDFGNSEKEKGNFVPGRYTPHARITMLEGMLRIARAIEDDTGAKVYSRIVRDMSAHFYPYIQDQLTLPLSQYWNYYRQAMRLGFGKTPYFHVYFILVRIIGRRRFDDLTQRIRDYLGRTPILR